MSTYKNFTKKVELSSWNNFTQKQKNIYGKRNNKEEVLEEINNTLDKRGSNQKELCKLYKQSTYQQTKGSCSK